MVMSELSRSVIPTGGAAAEVMEGDGPRAEVVPRAVAPTVVDATGGRAPRRGSGQRTVMVLVTVSELLEDLTSTEDAPTKGAAQGDSRVGAAR